MPSQKKGKGYRNAEKNPGKFHGIGAFDPSTGNCLINPAPMSYSQVFGNKLAELAAEDPKIVAVSAAMMEATGLSGFAKQYPERAFDAGIAEAHAVTFAAGLAANGYKPVVAVYSTFLQRSYDQILIDVCMQNLPVIFAIDRAGNVGSDGETHHGVFDLSYLSHMPNMSIMAPKDGQELTEMLEYAMSFNGPCAIRYPRGAAEEIINLQDRDADQEPGTDGFNNPIILGRSERLTAGKDVEIFAAGKMVSVGLAVCRRLSAMGISAGLINARFIKPLDEETILSVVDDVKYIVTLEDNVLKGGYGSIINIFLAEKQRNDVKVLNIGWPDQFIEHGNTAELFEKYGLDSESIAERVCNFLERKA